MIPKTVTLLFVCVVAMAGLLGTRDHSYSGQQQFPPGNRKPACTCFCGGATPGSFNLFDMDEIMAAKCFGGPLPADKCVGYVGDLPAETRKSICKYLKAKGTSNSSCPVEKKLAEYCKEQPPDTNCEKPVPWFDSSSSGCKDVQDTQITIDQRTATAVVSMCGYMILKLNSENFAANADPIFRTAFTAAFKQEIPKKVCCDKFREAARSGVPCNPRTDVDCDGTPNQTDTDSSLPAIDVFTRQKDAKIDQFPAGFDPYDPNFQPDSTARASKGVGDCACKWELIKGELKCNGAVGPDGTKQHVYIATWRCPTTKAEVFTTKYAPASAPCP